MERFVQLLGASKTLSRKPLWARPSRESDYSYFEAALDIGGITEPGLFLFGGCDLRRPDWHVTFELRLRQVKTRNYVQLDRLDWKPLTGGHTNQDRDYILYAKGQRIHGTHWHLYEYNAIPPDKPRRLLEDLPCAIAPPYGLETFQDLREFAGRVFRIDNMALVGVPPWGYALPL